MLKNWIYISLKLLLLKLNLCEWCCNLKLFLISWIISLQHIGPAIPEVSSVWFKLYIYHITGQGPPSLLLSKGTRLRKLPDVFQVVCVWIYSPFLLQVFQRHAVCYLEITVEVRGTIHCRWCSFSRSKFYVASWFVFFLGSEKGMLLMSLPLSECDSNIFDATPSKFSVKCGTAVLRIEVC